ncbi:septation protein IspZ [Psychrobacter urativorans]|uniref:Inner membrane-spanning protein YciB n=1 Tax=Psychrobacter urativorans TaxID=45610 RepID=A0A0M4U7G6_9GAMM|nr:septation protein IspZ [Psychrobacter urativorans]ALF60139.1 septation protein A [Psychrobacter urativorans]
MKALLDFIPLIAFFIAARTNGILAAAGALLIATLLIYTIHFVRQKGKFDKQQWVVLLLTVVFCGGTLILRDDIYLRWKSPIINGVFALTLLVSAAINKPLMQLAMKDVFNLSMRGWKQLTVAWALFFMLMGVLHYITAFTMTDEAWINFKTYGWIPIMLVFVIAQFLVLKKHINPALMDKTNK